MNEDMELVKEASGFFVGSILEPKARSGYACFCAHCGEPVGTGKYCAMCRTKAGRAEVDRLNAEINAPKQ